jgi:hypothetical protein
VARPGQQRSLASGKVVGAPARGGAIGESNGHPGVERALGGSNGRWVVNVPARVGAIGESNGHPGVERTSGSRTDIRESNGRPLDSPIPFRLTDPPTTPHSRPPLPQPGSPARLRHAIERILSQLVELAVSINSHIVVARQGTSPTTYRQSFRDVGAIGVLPSELAARLAVAAGLRNVRPGPRVPGDRPGTSRSRSAYCQVGLPHLCHACRHIHQLVEGLTRAEGRSASHIEIPPVPCPGAA